MILLFTGTFVTWSPCFLENSSWMCFFFTALIIISWIKTNLIIRWWSHLTSWVTERQVLILLPPLASKTTSNYERRFHKNLLYKLFNDWLWKASTLTYNKSLVTDVSKYRCLTNDLSKTKTKPTNGLLTTNNR